MTPLWLALSAFPSSRRIPRETGVADLHGTIRAIREDDTTSLLRAREGFGCVVLNLRMRHPPTGVAHTARVFRRLKRRYDPELRFQCEWWLHYAALFE